MTVGEQLKKLQAITDGLQNAVNARLRSITCKVCKSKIQPTYFHLGTECLVDVDVVAVHSFMTMTSTAVFVRRRSCAA
jgi:hypothetical protein